MDQLILRVLSLVEIVDLVITRQIPHLFSAHWNPDWFNEVKFGIFIHWGLYSAPAYGSVQPVEDYAEWYWKRMNDPTFRTQTYQYHEETYGENFNYDYFISNFTAAKWDAQAWVDLIAASGAQYMVPVTSKPTTHIFYFKLTFYQSTMTALRFSIFLLRSACDLPFIMVLGVTLLENFSLLQRHLTLRSGEVRYHMILSYQG